jgi:hypothetical protein
MPRHEIHAAHESAQIAMKPHWFGIGGCVRHAVIRNKNGGRGKEF